MTSRRRFAGREYGDANGNINYEQLSAAKASELKQLLAEITPYFDRLNHHKSSKEVLSSEEFNAYIEAEMTLETIRAKTGLTGNKGPIQANDIPTELRAEFEQAEQVLKETNRKITGNN
ncbi:DUF3600 domain-containing protein [Effusibacillus lacus]|uniref:ECF-type sigma factor negative effector n=1 Tax=Effusibacillus lacus TaxID=1348429 RepID=A0A292YKQ7_9BACL|nr:DUF3600 domain-containing protein [Effusibacillus lacus]TCS75087.1 uncharacterized protein DUF3600 [Effusibacillus lacus]GAX89040.1 ECF-type sigma factor negative effector [Effusibacillus lacus]